MSPSAPTRPELHFLVGPTASGKTAIAHRLAERLGARILSADAMLVYRGMDIGTAKPTVAERRRFAYRGVDLADPDQRFSVGAYLAQVRVLPAGRWLVVGGTGLYVRGLIEGLDPLPAADAALRAEAEALLASGGVAALREWLAVIGPAHLAALADPRNPRRLARAYELARLGVPPPRATWSAAPSSVRLAGLAPDRAWLGDRIARRVAGMFASGLIDEARGLQARWGPRLSETARKAIGYEEAFAVLDGTTALAEAQARTVLRTRQYAKRQMTWFRHQAQVDWVIVGEALDENAVADAVAAVWERQGPFVPEGAEPAPVTGERNNG